METHRQPQWQSQAQIDGNHLGVRAVYRVPNSESSSSAPDQNLCCDMGLLQMSSALTLFDSCSLARNIWRFPKIGVPPVLIQFSRLFRSKPYGPSSYWDTPMTQETPICFHGPLGIKCAKKWGWSKLQAHRFSRLWTFALNTEQAAMRKENTTNKRGLERKIERKKSSERERERENQREGKKDFMEKKTVHAIGPSGHRGLVWPTMAQRCSPAEGCCWSTPEQWNNMKHITIATIIDYPWRGSK